ncbi:uncharacterized protein LOC142344248 isoform X2 [Convolutriloba macropyga]|uniref:uncharacterized protein LOC142344248 isoform X2 n=1 Tax=Convolutriloba macropyga TaxID=536237 RepID=UPI003F523340
MKSWTLYLSLVCYWLSEVSLLDALQNAAVENSRCVVQNWKSNDTVTSEVVQIAAQGDGGLQRHLMLYIDYFCTDRALSNEDGNTYLVSEIHIMRRENSGASSCHQVVLDCTDISQKRTLSVLTMDRIRHPKIYQIHQVELHGSSVQDALRDDLVKEPKHVARIGPSPVSEEQLDSEHEPARMDRCIRSLIEPSEVTSPDNKKPDEGTAEPNMFNIVLTVVLFLLFLLVVTVVSCRSRWTNDVAQSLQVRFSLRRKRKGTINKKKFDEAMANDEEEDYAVLITAESKGTGTHFSSHHVLLSDSDTDLFYAR